MRLIFYFFDLDSYNVIPVIGEPSLYAATIAPVHQVLILCSDQSLALPGEATDPFAKSGKHWISLRRCLQKAAHHVLRITANNRINNWLFD